MANSPQPVHTSLVDRAWRFFTSPAAVGALIAASGLVCVVASIRAPAGGWLEPLRPHYGIAAAAGLLGAAVVLGAAGFGERWRRSRAPADGSGSTWRSRRLPALGAALVGLGTVLSVGSWFARLPARPPGELELATGEKAEHFRGRVAGEPLEIMLPVRVQLDSMRLRGRPTFELAFARPGEEPFRRTKLHPGESEQIRGVELTPVGLSREAGGLRATIGSMRDETIEARVGPGESFRLRPDGAEYTVEEIQKNYLDSLGPAVKVDSPESGTFWVFQNLPDEPSPPEFAHDLRVRGLERTSGAVFSVTTPAPDWIPEFGGILVVAGLVVVVSVPERVLVDGSGGELRTASFNDAGTVAVDEDGEEET